MIHTVTWRVLAVVWQFAWSATWPSKGWITLWAFWYRWTSPSVTDSNQCDNKWINSQPLFDQQEETRRQIFGLSTTSTSAYSLGFWIEWVPTRTPQTLAWLSSQLRKKKKASAAPLLLVLSLWVGFSATTNHICKRRAAVWWSFKRPTRFQLLYCGMNIKHLRCSTFLQLGRSCASSECLWFNLGYY